MQFSCTVYTYVNVFIQKFQLFPHHIWNHWTQPEWPTENGSLGRMPSSQLPFMLPKPLTIHQECSALNMDSSDNQLMITILPLPTNLRDWLGKLYHHLLFIAHPKSCTNDLSLQYIYMHWYQYYKNTCLPTHNDPLRLPGMWSTDDLSRFQSTQIGHTAHLGQLGA